MWGRAPHPNSCRVFGIRRIGQQTASRRCGENPRLTCRECRGRQRPDLQSATATCAAAPWAFSRREACRPERKCLPCRFCVRSFSPVYSVSHYFVKQAENSSKICQRGGMRRKSRRDFRSAKGRLPHLESKIRDAEPGGGSWSPAISTIPSCLPELNRYG